MSNNSNFLCSFRVYFTNGTIVGGVVDLKFELNRAPVTNLFHYPMSALGPGCVETQFIWRVY